MEMNIENIFPALYRRNMKRIPNRLKLYLTTTRVTTVGGLTSRTTQRTQIFHKNLLHTDKFPLEILHENLIQSKSHIINCTDTCC